MGDLTPVRDGPGGALLRRRVVALFNKGAVMVPFTSKPRVFRQYGLNIVV